MEKKEKKENEFNSLFQFIRLLGSGAQASVSLYRDKRVNVGKKKRKIAKSFVAIKKIRCYGTKSVKDLEERLLRLLNLPIHANLVKLDEFFIQCARSKEIFKNSKVLVKARGESKRPKSAFVMDADLFLVCIVMDFCNASTLGDALKKKSLRQKHCRQWILQIAKGIDTLHRQDIIHRDLKPENIFLHDSTYFESGKVSFSAKVANRLAVKIGDFGELKFLEKSLTHSKCGTLDFMSPEIYHGHGCDSSTDIWSLGIIVLNMLVTLDNSLLNKVQSFQQIRNHLTESRRKNTRMRIRYYEKFLDSNLDQKLLTLLFNCCSFLPENRPTANEIVIYLEGNERFFRGIDPLEIKKNRNDEELVTEGLEYDEKIVPRYQKVRKSRAFLELLRKTPSAAQLWEDCSDTTSVSWASFSTEYRKKCGNMSSKKKKALKKLLDVTDEQVGIHRFSECVSTFGFPFHRSFLDMLDKYVVEQDLLDEEEELKRKLFSKLRRKKNARSRKKEEEEEESEEDEGEEEEEEEEGEGESDVSTEEEEEGEEEESDEESEGEEDEEASLEEIKEGGLMYMRCISECEFFIHDKYQNCFIDIRQEFITTLYKFEDILELRSRNCMIVGGKSSGKTLHLKSLALEFVRRRYVCGEEVILNNNNDLVVPVYVDCQLLVNDFDEETDFFTQCIRTRPMFRYKDSIEKFLVHAYELGKVVLLFDDVHYLPRKPGKIFRKIKSLKPISFVFSSKVSDETLLKTVGISSKKSVFPIPFLDDEKQELLIRKVDGRCISLLNYLSQSFRKVPILLKLAILRYQKLIGPSKVTRGSFLSLRNRSLSGPSSPVSTSTRNRSGSVGISASPKLKSIRNIGSNLKNLSRGPGTEEDMTLLDLTEPNTTINNLENIWCYEKKIVQDFVNLLVEDLIEKNSTPEYDHCFIYDESCRLFLRKLAWFLMMNRRVTFYKSQLENRKELRDIRNDFNQCESAIKYGHFDFLKFDDVEDCYYFMYPEFQFFFGSRVLLGKLEKECVEYDNEKRSVLFDFLRKKRKLTVLEQLKSLLIDPWYTKIMEHTYLRFNELDAKIFMKSISRVSKLSPFISMLLTSIILRKRGSERLEADVFSSIVAILQQKKKKSDRSKKIWASLKYGLSHPSLWVRKLSVDRVIQNLDVCKLVKLKDFLQVVKPSEVDMLEEHYIWSVSRIVNIRGGSGVISGPSSVDRLRLMIENSWGKEVREKDKSLNMSFRFGKSAREREISKLKKNLLLDFISALRRLLRSSLKGSKRLKGSPPDLVRGDTSPSFDSPPSSPSRPSLSPLAFSPSRAKKAKLGVKKMRKLESYLRVLRYFCDGTNITPLESQELKELMYRYMLFYYQSNQSLSALFDCIVITLNLEHSIRSDLQYFHFSKWMSVGVNVDDIQRIKSLQSIFKLEKYEKVTTILEKLKTREEETNSKRKKAGGGTIDPELELRRNMEFEFERRMEEQADPMDGSDHIEFGDVELALKVLKNLVLFSEEDEDNIIPRRIRKLVEENDEVEKKEEKKKEEKEEETEGEIETEDWEVVKKGGDDDEEEEDGEREDDEDDENEKMEKKKKMIEMLRSGKLTFLETASSLDELELGMECVVGEIVKLEKILNPSDDLKVITSSKKRRRSSKRRRRKSKKKKKKARKKSMNMKINQKKRSYFEGIKRGIFMCCQGVLERNHPVFDNFDSREKEIESLNRQKNLKLYLFFTIRFIAKISTNNPFENYLENAVSLLFKEMEMSPTNNNYSSLMKIKELAAKTITNIFFDCCCEYGEADINNNNNSNNVVVVGSVTDDPTTTTTTTQNEFMYDELRCTILDKFCRCFLNFKELRPLIMNELCKISMKNSKSLSLSHLNPELIPNLINLSRPDYLADYLLVALYFMVIQKI